METFHTKATCHPGRRSLMRFQVAPLPFMHQGVVRVGAPRAADRIRRQTGRSKDQIGSLIAAVHSLHHRQSGLTGPGTFATVGFGAPRCRFGTMRGNKRAVCRLRPFDRFGGEAVGLNPAIYSGFEFKKELVGAGWGHRFCPIVKRFNRFREHYIRIRWNQASR